MDVLNPERQLDELAPSVKKLIISASEFVRKACEELAIGHSRHFCVNAATSIELISKAALTELSPALISADDYKSLLMLLGHERYAVAERTRVKTISGRKALERFVFIQPSLTPIQNDLHVIFDIRDGTVHLNTSDKEELLELGGAYWTFLKTSAEFLKISAEHVVNDDDYVKLLAEHADRNKSIGQKSVTRKLTAAKKYFHRRFQSIPEKEVKMLQRYLKPSRRLYADVSVFTKCPACGMLGELGCYERTSEDVLFDSEGKRWKEVVWHPKYFMCSYCQLELEGKCELAVVGLDNPIEDAVEADGSLDDDDYCPEGPEGDY